MRAYGEFPHGNVIDFDWEEVPLEDRDGWFFYCERCAQLVFPGIVFHRGTSYHMPHQGDEEESNADDGCLASTQQQPASEEETPTTATEDDVSTTITEDNAPAIDEDVAIGYKPADASTIPGVEPRLLPRT